MPSINDIPGGVPLLTVQMGTAALSGSTASAGQLTPTGQASLVYMANTGATPGTYTTRTAAQMITDGPLVVGQQYLLVIANNQGTGTLTLAGGSNVTASGTLTVAANTARLFVVTVTSATTMTIVGLAFGWSSNV